MSTTRLDRAFLRFRDRGDGQALAAVFDETAADLLRLAAHLVSNQTEAEDLVQSTFLAAIRRADRYEAGSSLPAWLYGILWREAARARRRAARRVEPERLTERTVPPPEASAQAEEIEERVDRALDGLPPRYREVLDAFVRRGERPEEIARRLGRAPGTVRSQLSRGMDRLRRSLPPSLAPTWGAVGVEGLDTIRSEVLRAAAARPVGVRPAGGEAVLAGKAGAGTALSAKLALGATLAAGAALVSWSALGTNDVPPARAAASPGGAAEAAPVAASPPALPRPEEPPRAVAPVRAPEVAGSAPEDPLAYWRARFAEKPDDWRHGWSVAEEIAALEPDEAVAVMRGVWPSLSVPVKEQVMKPFVFQGGHPGALQILDLAAHDEAPTVQSRAFLYLKDYAFEDFSEDFGRYLAWSARYRDRPLSEVLAENAEAFVARLLAAGPDELARQANLFRRFDFRNGAAAGVDVARHLRAAGMAAVLENGLAHGDPQVRARMFAWAADVDVGETWVRQRVPPILADPSSVGPEVFDAALQALESPKQAWARDPLLELIDRHPHDSFLVRSAARALSALGDPTVIPRLIRRLGRETDESFSYDVGYFGLHKLTGVEFDESHDGEWWLDWWARNLERFPPEARAIPVQ